MSFNIDFTYSASGFVSVKIPTAELGANYSVEQAPFRLMHRSGDNAFAFEEFITPSGPYGGWTAANTGDFTTYTRNSTFPFGTDVELVPLANVNNPNYISFTSAGFKPAGTTYTASATDPYPPDFAPPTLVSISKLSDFVPDSGTTVVTPSGTDPTKAYYVAKFSEGVTGVTNQNFNVTQNGASTQNYTVHTLWLNNSTSTWSTTLTGSSTISPLHLVTVNGLVAGTTPILSVALKAPPAILSVQEMIAAPSFEAVIPGSHGTLPTSGQSSWMKVRLDGDAFQYLSDNPTVPRLEYGYSGTTSFPTPAPTPTYVIAGKEAGVLYLGFNSDIQEPSQAPTSIKFQQTTNVSTIKDLAGNFLIPSASSSTPVEYIPKWGEDTTTISDNNLVGYSNGYNFEFNRGEYDSSLPKYSTDGKPLEWLSNGKPKYDNDGDLIGLDTIDLSGINSSSITINAVAGEAYVFFGGEALNLDVSNYDRYILNNQVGNVFLGTEDSEYVVVGTGGGNILDAVNQDMTDISSNVKVKNFVFDSAGIVRETDIVDYSQLSTGISVDLGALGADVSQGVTVDYLDSEKIDTLIGFEGVVGSGGNDLISGSDVGNALAGGAGNDVLRGYTGAVDNLYNPSVVVADYGTKGNSSYKEAQFLVDSSDILYGGAGADTLYGGAGRDLLLDLGKAEMWGSDKKGFNGDDVFSGEALQGRALRDSSRKDLAENDIFWLRGDGAEKATINNFHLSKDGTGLAGRSNSANDALLFAIDTTKIMDASTYKSFTTSEALYDYVYSRLTFEQKNVGSTDDRELVVNFKQDSYSTKIQVGSTIIADMGSMLNGDKNRAEVVELKWLSKGDDPLELFNPKINKDLIRLVDDEFGSSSMNIAVALELLQAGTVRGTNEFGVMAAKLSDKNLDERIYNPGNKDDRILGTAKDDSYEYVVQQFTPTPPPATGATTTTTAVISDQVGKDAIFDIGGNNDVLMFESARLQDLTFSAVKVGRESKANSLKVVHKQTEALDDGLVENRGEVVWQGHYKAGGRQELEVLKIDGQEFEIAKAVYEYNSKGYAKGGPKITADNARDVIMVGQGEGDNFVFDLTSTGVFAPPSGASADKNQTARIAGFGSKDKIDISDFGAVLSSDSEHINGQDSTATIKFTSGFELNLSFQGAVTDDDLRFALGATLFT